MNVPTTHTDLCLNPKTPHCTYSFPWVFMLVEIQDMPSSCTIIRVHISRARNLSCMGTNSHVPFHTDAEGSDAIRDSAFDKMSVFTALHALCSYFRSITFSVNSSLPILSFGRTRHSEGVPMIAIALHMCACAPLIG